MALEKPQLAISPKIAYHSPIMCAQKPSAAKPAASKPQAISRTRRRLVGAGAGFAVLGAAAGMFPGAALASGHGAGGGAMTSRDQFCSLLPYFKVHAGKLGEFKALCEEFVAKTRSEPKCLFYGWTFDGDTARCREAYEDAAGLLAHLDNVGPLVDRALKIADLASVEVHGPASELATLKEPLKGLNPRYFTFEVGFAR